MDGSDTLAAEPATHAHPPPAAARAPTRGTYKSMKKKYRKLRVKFDQVMRDSDLVYKQEQDAIETVKRLMRQNDRLLDMLLDANNSSHLPASHRVDLSENDAHASKVLPYISDADLDGFSTDRPDLKQVYDDLHALIDQRTAAKLSSAAPAKSLSQLSSTVPHRSLANGSLPPELAADVEFTKDGSLPTSYMSLEQLDDYLYDVDVTAGIALLSSHAPSATGAGILTAPSTEKEIALRNPHSVYNWLRKHEPSSFLADHVGAGAGDHKPGSGAKGPGRGSKRASLAASRQAEGVEFVEEDSSSYRDGAAPGRGAGLGPAPAAGVTGPGASKRKRAGDDEHGYRPRASHGAAPGSARPSKKKRKSDDPAGAGVSGGGDTPTPKVKRQPRDSAVATMGMPTGKPEPSE